MQDLEVVVLHKKNPSIKTGPKNIVKKNELPVKKVSSSVKLNENDEVVKIKYVPKDISQLIITGRIAKKLTRKDLANKLNYKEDIIANIETSKAIYNGDQIAKIKKILNI